ncbi:zinc finger, C2H2 type protein [Rhizoctonia solani AG-3 Rhs1AP]|uniref:Zinc finger, C2H2 type protein n=2 Tax=Rhizoctonia solani AG-3 TaxID=1086053 RepID=A0A074RFS0_9AGAM|nr:zinc finger, C2H2 type protein [Rhizoctonia solani AG-3 Rhs1AP]KEP45624.1 zinc finger, C2H2 type protein [Rhizoctonia solani 123E]
MEFLIFFWTLMAEALFIMSVLEFDIEAELPSALTRILKKLGHNLAWSPNYLAGITTKSVHRVVSISKGVYVRVLIIDHLLEASGGDDLKKGLKLSQALAPDKHIQHSFGPKSNRHCFPRALLSKGYNCPTHKGSVVGCATFFEHENYEYKLLYRGELYFRPKGAHTFRTGPIVPKEPARLFVVKLDDTGSNVVIFCFEPSSRALGEVNGHAEFLPVQTSIASSQEAHGLVYTQGQGCVFDWVYGDRSSTQYIWDYNIHYDVGWMHSSPSTEKLFASTDKALVECCTPFANSNPLRHSLQGLDSVANLLLPDDCGEIQAGFAHIELTTGTQPTENTYIPSLSDLPALPALLAAPYHSEASASANPRATSRSVLRRTCNICGRVLRRPSALTIHLNAHYGIKPFQCNECTYSSTNITNLQRHKQVRHPGSSSGGV